MPNTGNTDVETLVGFATFAMTKEARFEWLKGLLRRGKSMAPAAEEAASVIPRSTPSMRMPILPMSETDDIVRSAISSHPQSAVDLDLMRDMLARGGRPASFFDPRITVRAGLPANAASGALGSLPFNIGSSVGPGFSPIPSYGRSVLRTNFIPTTAEEIASNLSWRPGGVPGIRRAPILPTAPESFLPTLPRGIRMPMAFEPTGRMPVAAAFTEQLPGGYHPRTSLIAPEFSAQPRLSSQQQAMADIASQKAVGQAQSATEQLPTGHVAPMENISPDWLKAEAGTPLSPRVRRTTADFEAP